jgi:hypothetical protein
MTAYAQDTAAGAFAQARDCYAEIERWLGSAEAAALTHAELEDQLGSRGRELLRRLFQGTLDLRALREQRHDVIADGVPRTRVEKNHSRPLGTVSEEVTVTRMAYRAPGAANAYPADAELNLPEESTPTGCASWPRPRRLAARIRTRPRRFPVQPGCRSGNGRWSSSPCARQPTSMRSMRNGNPIRHPMSTCW